MKSSVSRLDPVLRHRELAEDQARQALSEVLRQEQEARRLLELCSERLGDLQKELQQKQQQGISVQDLLLFEESIAHQGRRRGALRDELAALERKVEKRRQELTSACQDRKLIEKLREKRQAELARRLQRQETATLDEIALQFTKGRL